VSPERWQQIEEIYHATLERAAEERSAFLNQACADDEDLRREVESLAASHDQAGLFLEAPPDEVAAEMLAREQKPSIIGQTLGHYQLQSLLGAGGMGEVYLALDTRLERKVALKLLPAEFTRDRERVQRFQREARAASALNHPNIITVFEVGQAGSLHFIVTEFIDGQTLRRLASSGEIKLRDAIEIVIQSASALTSAHEAGIVHRDIKPENIMLRRDGYVKILDFGLAKLTEHLSADDSTLISGGGPVAEQLRTETGLRLGTPRYMAPEQIRGQELDGRSDLFSLGVVLFELVAGRPPFAGATPLESVAEILHTDAPPLSRYTREAPAELERIVSKALAKDRDQRYQNAKDLLIDLRNLKLELEVEAKLRRVDRASSEEAVTESEVATAPLPPARRTDRAAQNLRSRMSLPIAIVAGLIALLSSGVIAYRAFNPAREAASQSGPALPTPNAVEVIRYRLEVEAADGAPARAAGDAALAAGETFRFNFTPRERGYLYIVGPGERNVPTTFLTAQPHPQSGATTNRIEAGAEYRFPSGDGSIRIGRYGTINNFTIIFSPTPLTQPAFLAGRAYRQLTAPEQRELEAFWNQYGKLAPDLTLAENSNQVLVTAPADRAKTAPLIFDIPIKRQ
jgi:serine/threonine protein kinase